MALPPGQDEIYKNRIYSLEKIPTSSEEILGIQGKKAKKLSQERADVLEKFLNENRERLTGMVSVEWIGKKFQQTPGIREEVAVIAHSDMKIENFGIEFERSFDKLEEVFNNLIIELRFIKLNMSTKHFKLEVEKSGKMEKISIRGGFLEENPFHGRPDYGNFKSHGIFEKSLGSQSLKHLDYTQIKV